MYWRKVDPKEGGGGGDHQEESPVALIRAAPSPGGGPGGSRRSPPGASRMKDRIHYRSVVVMIIPPACDAEAGPQRLPSSTRQSMRPLCAARDGPRRPSALRGRRNVIRLSSRSSVDTTRDHPRRQASGLSGRPPAGTSGLF